MESNVKDKIEFKDKLINFYTYNKFKIYFVLAILTIFLLISFTYKIYLEKENKHISENYIKAGIYLKTGKKKQSIEIYKDIIDSKNTFYSILSLNNLLEKNLIVDQKIILGFFENIEKKIKSKNQKDLLIFKKALYLIKNKKNNEAKKLLENLIKNNSQIKSLSLEVISNYKL